MRRLYAFSNRNPSLPIEAYDDDVEEVRVIRTTNKTVRNDDQAIIRKSTNNVIEHHNTDVNYIESADNVYLKEQGRCPYVRFPWWLWLLLALGLLSLIGLALGLGLGLGLKKTSVNSRCGSGTCPSNSQCINNRCECNSGYFYDYSLSTCTANRHVGMTCTTSNTATQCITNAYCASNGYCLCNTGYFLDQNTGACTALLARYIPCASDDQCVTPFVCKVNLCDCNQTSYYDSGTNTCKRLGYLNEPCAANSQCVRTANCTTTTCQCAPDHYWDNAAYQCIRDQFIGRTCTLSYECIANANCTSVSPFSNQCECYSGLYYNPLTATCVTQLPYSMPCTTTYSCVNNLLCMDDPATNGVLDLKCLCTSFEFYVTTNQTCVPLGTYGDSCNAAGRLCFTGYGLSCSATTSTCQCSSIDYWNGTLCVALRYPGQSCTATAQCINSSSCTSSICVCNTNYYYSRLTGICTPQLVYSTSCTLGNYQCLNNTLCYDLKSPPATCSCDPTYYYYDGTRCSLYATYGQTCAVATYGPYCDASRTLICIGSVCTCSSATTYYNTTSCVPYILVGFSCTATSQCVTNAYCASSGICLCSTGYYFDSTTTGNCLLLLTWGQGCTLSTQCSTNMVCTAAKCMCTANTYYVNPNCISSISYNGVCSVTTLCDTTLGLVCVLPVCKCSNTQYWSTLSNGTQICANLRTLGQSCTAYTDCVNSATSVKCISNICECDSSGYYLQQSTVTCVPLLINGAPCAATYNFQCASFNCNTTAVCGNTIASTITSNVTQAISNASLRQYYITLCFIMIFIWKLLL